VRQIINAAPLPVLVDVDDGYGDAKIVTRTVREYEAMGVPAIFIEDQAAPKTCGHMEGKKIIEQKPMVHIRLGAIVQNLDNWRRNEPLLQTLINEF
jgi:2-methylisocitrate lyase-like PEP mutase family enzyme